MWQRPRAPPGGLYGDDENVPGRATMKLRSIEIQRECKASPLKGSPGLNQRSSVGMFVSGPSGPARALGPPQPLNLPPQPPQQREWKLTDEMMSRPWGSVLRSLNR